jgi:hypothetical protein
VKTDADAIRWNFWDGKSTMTFTGDPEDFRHVPIGLPLSMAESVKTEGNRPGDAILVRAIGEALVREVRLLRSRSGSSTEPSLATPELQTSSRVW